MRRTERCPLSPTKGGLLNKLAHYLQEHLLGEVTSAADTRRHFAHDGSILQIPPVAVVYPANEDDVRKTVRFAWQLAQRGKKIPITPRGMGSSTSGTAIGSGIVLVFPAHMNKLLELKAKKKLATLQPGLNFGALEQVLHSHKLCLPPYPQSLEYSTVGGCLAANSLGEKSVKYGAIGGYMDSLRVVLSNGEVIETWPLSKKELNGKMGLQNLEGEIYRSLDTLIEENGELIAAGRSHIKAMHNAVGYNIFDIKKDGDFDLTPLIIGSLGSLGIITEATVEVKDYRPTVSQALISLGTYENLHNILPKLLELKPSMVDMLNSGALGQILAINPSQLEGLELHHEATLHLFIEFDDGKEAEQKKKIKELEKLAERNTAWSKAFPDSASQASLRKLRDSIAILLQTRGADSPVPVAEDICVPVNRLAEFLEEAEATCHLAGVPAAFWGHAGLGTVSFWPALDLSKTGDRQKFFKLQGELYSAAVRLGGSPSAAAGDGRIRAPYSQMVLGPELHRLMLAIKKIFDPHDILNTGVKTASTEEVKSMLRTQYSLANFYDYLPRN